MKQSQNLTQTDRPSLIDPGPYKALSKKGHGIYFYLSKNGTAVRLEMDIVKLQFLYQTIPADELKKWNDLSPLDKKEWNILIQMLKNNINSITQ